ncbi:hypothetical protein KL86CLO1_13111 [uncultured Eubacteriales bacterium]|uniref:Uncharacterized protein n=1 Tax=uncultured Eubacteriales bacterium TaxID=172733 RepID=A0A212KH41_9FIRM|nr:hypothetical protein KL86CLO1_13111 [uncultured Eubacteriales bacterium]
MFHIETISLLPLSFFLFFLWFRLLLCNFRFIIIHTNTSWSRCNTMKYYVEKEKQL